jgi:GT2 family glycosyltransferase
MISIKLVNRFNFFKTILRKWKFIRYYFLVKNSGLFDEKYYLETNPDVRETGISAFKHYLLFGGFEGRRPSIKFDSALYLEIHQINKDHGVNPLIHYLKYRKKKTKIPQNPIPKSFLGRFHREPSSLHQDSDKRRLLSDVLCFPTFFTLVVISRGETTNLKKTINSIKGQTYVYWQCLVYSHKRIDECSNIEIKEIESEILEDEDNRLQQISNLDHIFTHVNQLKGYILFIEEGELLVSECLWEFYNARDEVTDILFSDHDTVTASDQHHTPWFTFNWAPDLLLSQNYIGGIYAISTDLFITSYNNDALNSFYYEIAHTKAWRYGMLINSGNKAKRIQRIPKILWSTQEKEEKILNTEYQDEIKEIYNYFKSQDIQIKINENLKGKVRQVVWPLVYKPLISIIIPTTGKMEILKVCIDGLLEKTEYKNIEIIILDNGRGKHSDGIEYVKSRGIRVIEENDCFNWSRLNNKGVLHARGEMLLFLNDDIEVIEPFWLTELVRLAQREEIGVVGNLLLYPSSEIQHAGVFLVDHGGGARHIFYRQPNQDKKYHDLDKSVREVSANTGACMMVRRKIFEELGGFDENFAIVGNDIDFCLRSLDAGYRNLWTPDSKLIHHESISRKATPIEKDEREIWHRWRHFLIKGDYYYNPNLTLHKEDFSINQDSIYTSNGKIFDYLAAEKNIESVKNKGIIESFNSLNQANLGVNLISYMRAEMGIGEAARGNAKALHSANIPFCVINFEKNNPSLMRDFSFRHREVFGSVFDINILQINADYTPYACTYLGNTFFENKYTIGIWAWELEEFPDFWADAFDYVHEIWVPSTFVNKAVTKKSPVPVFTIPHSIQTINNMERIKNTNRSYFNLPDHSFVFLSVFDVHSVTERKNPFGSIIAFKKSFKENDTSVTLIIKVTNPDEETLKKLRDAIGGYKNIIVFTRNLSRIEMEWLMCTIDCYLSLHRSEGFGLGPAQAMARGKVAILTNWSGNTDYMTNDNCIPISYQLQQLGQDFGPYEKHQFWAEPDLEEASFMMRSLISDPQMVKKIGRQARTTMAQNFSPEKVGQHMKDRIYRISLQI